MGSTNDVSKMDSVGGCSIVGFQGETLTIRDDALYALDVLDAPNLVTLQLARLKADQAPHLLIDNAPNLRHIVLPPEGAGAVIHLNCNQAVHELTIEGPVGEIDAAWPGVQFRQEASTHRKNWNRVTVYGADQMHRHSADGGLMIVTGVMPTATEHLRLDACCDWLLTDIDGVSHLQITGTGSVSVDQLPSLRTLFSDNSNLQLSLTRTPRLKRISGCGELVTVRQSEWEHRELTIDGRWKHAKIASDRLEKLTYKDGRSLTVYHCSRLKVANLALGMDIECHGALPAPLAESARFFFDEATLHHNIEALRAGDKSVLPVTLRVLSGAHEPAQVVQCLQQLAELCALGIAPEKIWACRRELSARHRNARSRRKARGLRPLNQTALAKADFNWHWHLPEDLAPQGWEADLDVWLYCQHSVFAAAEFGEVMAHTCQAPEALDTLIRKAGLVDQDKAVKALALQAIEHYVRKDADYMLGRHGRGSNDPIKRLARLFHDERTTAAQRRALIEFLCNVPDLDRLLASVPELLSLAPGLVRAELMKLSRKRERWFIPRIPSLRLHRTQPTVDRYRSKLKQAALASAVSRPAPEPTEQLEMGQTLQLFEETH